MSSEIVDVSYEPFSREPEYIEFNRLFVESLRLTPAQRILDLACGTGTLTALVCEDRRLKSPAADGLIVGLDLSRESLAHAREYLTGLGFWGEQGVRLIEGSAESLPFASLNFDAVVVGNAIQLFENKERAAGEVSRVLRPGGLFAFNTSFYVGTYVPGTEGFYMSWVEEAVRSLMRRDEELKRRGLPGVKRKKSLAHPAFSRPWLSREEYERLLERHGFEVRSVVERVVMLKQSNLETIGSYAGLAGVLLRGYPIRMACEVLEQSAGPALAAAGMEAVPRHWLELIAVKK